MTNSEEPFFSIDSLDAYTSFDTYGDNALKAIIFAVNQKGRSHGVVIRDFLFENNVENRAGNLSNLTNNFVFLCHD